MTREEYQLFLEHRLKQHCIFGNDYYHDSTSIACSPTATPIASGEVFGYTEITRQYYNRYRLPVMHTETNLKEGPHGDEAVQMAVEGMGQCPAAEERRHPDRRLYLVFRLTDQVDWDTALREQNGNVNPLGLFDLDRKIRNVGRAYKQLIADWRQRASRPRACAWWSDQEGQRASRRR